MGITGLNEITKVSGVKTFNDKQFDTIIIDGSNLISIFLYGCRKDLTDETDIPYILSELIKGVVNSFELKIQNFKKKYKPKDIIITFDTQEKLKYEFIKYFKYDKDSRRIVINGKFELEEFDFKEAERQKRQESKSKTVDSDIFVKVDSNLMSVVPTIISILSNQYKDNELVTIIETQDEADFVIKNFVYLYSSFEKDILIVSEDTDYFVLLCEFPSVYKIGALQKSNKNIYNISQVWKNYLGTTDYQEIVFIGLFAGCDYTVHKTYLTFNENGHYKKLYNNPSSLKTNKRLHFVRDGHCIERENDKLERYLYFLKVIETFSEEEIIQMVNILNLYHSWRLINRFEYIRPNIQANVEKLKKRYKFESELNLYPYYEEQLNTEMIEEEIGDVDDYMINSFMTSAIPE